MLQLEQQKKIKNIVKLFTECQLAFANTETSGIKIDIPYLEQAITDTKQQLISLEDAVWQSEVGQRWRKIFGNSASLTTRQQLGTVLYNNIKNPHPDNLGFDCKNLTPTGLPKADEESLDQLPEIGNFTKDYILWMAMSKMLATNLYGIKNSLDSHGFTHPSFSLFSVISYRTSGGGSGSINIQNLPNHNPLLSQIVRQCFIPRAPDRHFVEIDFSGAEVRTTAVITQDPTLLGSIDQGVDFHKSIAARAYLLPEEEVTKTLRQSVKGPYTFQAFYGGYYGQIAEGLWMQIEYGIGGAHLTLKDGTPLKEHLARNGITELGNPDNPMPGTYNHHIKQCDDWFWNEKFQAYGQWRWDNWRKYLKNGYVDSPAGTRCAGVFVRNVVNNVPSQGSAALALLWCYVRVAELFRKYKMRSLLIGEIHDSLLGDFPAEELDNALEICYDVMTVQLPKEWSWLPKMDADIAVAEAGKSWFHKKEYTLKRLAN